MSDHGFAIKQTLMGDVTKYEIFSSDVTKYEIFSS
jgi:hypothetical protein